jgi:hypothetical protein
MMWDHTAYCRRCRTRVFVAPRRYSTIGDDLLMVFTLGLWGLVRRWKPQRFGLWQCDECGSLRCISARKVALDENGNRIRRRKRKRKA